MTISGDNRLAGRQVVVGVCGGIAAYKVCDLVSRLARAGSKVQVIMTRSATKFVAPLTFQALSNQPVITELFGEIKQECVAHVSVAEAADVFVVAPATANIIGKLRAGIADDFLATTLLATKAPVVLAPAMNVNMFSHPAVRENLTVLRERGVIIIEPETGRLACGTSGKGRLAPVERILAGIQEALALPPLLAGCRVLVTAGGTREAIDPVRYITNRSSGKMGYALAGEAVRFGAAVTLVTTPTGLPVPVGAKVIPVESALEMREVVQGLFDQVDVVIKAAAVADYRPACPAKQKVKKNAGQLTIELVRNPDILAELGQRKRHQVLVGFAAETNDVEKHALEKLHRKNLDLLVANDVTASGAGFGTDTNIVTLYDANGGREALGLLPKTKVACRILERVAAVLPAR
ncbi:MAG: bifunctional phosphopantothenoylcysteine decarboxylase/phosphopantothenate--cysteine ligase CoaBC [Heliobacteriaceae bacterium]|nr:bifunctional phosphopantothenoylcysteine decarboxylase/phosphopantothenate--cysteine ligase CoaBC [Heliobacteriaceae bacterium]MDD4586977.1 bifunctional phosphopantothenoylcysteine decarboxylase/phosphopantothenate--cysteine ligase CoaBC [Heliobacteriaceae bacterium]